MTTGEAAGRSQEPDREAVRGEPRGGRRRVARRRQRSSRWPDSDEGSNSFRSYVL